MEKAVKELFQSLVLNREKCPWARERDMALQVKELASEVEELRQGIENNNVANIREEMGDVLWDLLFIGVLAEEKGLFTMKDVLVEANEKLKRRKPWVFGEEKVANAEEAVKRWYEIKKEEKKAKLNSAKAEGKGPKA